MLHKKTIERRNPKEFMDNFTIQPQNGYLLIAFAEDKDKQFDVFQNEKEKTVQGIYHGRPLLNAYERMQQRGIKPMSNERPRVYQKSASTT